MHPELISKSLSQKGRREEGWRKDESSLIDC